MFRKFLIIVLLAISITGISQETKKVLFVGNSFTYYNNLPDIVYNLAENNGDSLIFDSSTPGGYSFNAHSTNTTTLSKIQQTDWDFVTLQGQSQECSRPYSEMLVNTVPYAKILVDSIKSNNLCTEPLFFMTWGWKDGDFVNCTNDLFVCTYNGMQQRSREGYLQLGVNNNSSVAPLGMAWKHSIDSVPTLNLYSTDNYHPNIKGSYLSACVFYAMIFDKSPMGINYYSTLEQDTAEYLQYIAHHTVFDSLYLWERADVIPTSSFNYSINNGDVQFTNTSTDSREYYWNFDDGTFSYLENPNHTYTANGNYVVELNSISITCDTAIFTDTINIVLVNINNEVIDNEIIISPNPASTFLKIESEKHNIESCSVFDISGKMLISYQSKNTIDISGLEKGVYLLKLQTENGVVVRKFIRE